MLNVCFLGWVGVNRMWGRVGKLSLLLYVLYDGWVGEWVGITIVFVAGWEIGSYKLCVTWWEGVQLSYAMHLKINVSNIKYKILLLICDQSLVSIDSLDIVR